MLTTILAFFSTFTGQASAVAVGLWILGTFGKSVWYQKIREAIGRGAEAAGVAVSALGTSKLKSLWNPIETVICDFLFFAVEQFAVGLRKDDPEKMEVQLARLESVGSQSRADAIAVKLGGYEATQPHRDKNDAVVMAQAVASAEEGNRERLKG